MLGVIAALPWELKTLTHQAIRAGSCAPISDDITVALSGIGAERADAAAALLLSRGATGLLSWGCAAALQDDFAPGTVVLPEWVLEATGEKYPVTREWHHDVYGRLYPRYPVRTDALVESVALVKTPPEKSTLARNTGALATDMESAAQARFAREHSLPFIAVRAILDSASSRVPADVLQALTSDGTLSACGILRGVAFRPAQWTTFAKLGMQFHAARKTLKQTRAAVLDASRTYLDRISPGKGFSARE